MTSAVLAAKAVAPVQATAPRSLRAWAPWLGFAALLLAAPHLFPGDLALSIASQAGIAIIACLSYNILLGQGGMLSFGHAVYSGLGAFCAIHAMNVAPASWLHVPIVLVPLVGGAAGLLCASVLGYATTRMSGTTFAMVTLGIGELVASMSLMIPEFFGGEGGVTTDRTAGGPFLGLTFGPQIQVYYLIAAYCLACTALMYALTRTPLGQMLNAVRDNPHRVEFIGYRARHVRYLSFVIAAFFAGIAGGLAAVNFEIVTSEVVGSARSGAYLLFVYIGGTGAFYGPMLGAVLMVLAMVLLSEFTKAWLLYLGIAFIAMVMYAPGGLAQVVQSFAAALRGGAWRRLWGRGALVALSGGAFVLAFIVAVELLYQRQAQEGGGEARRILGLALDPASQRDWFMVLAVLTACAFLLAAARRGWSAAAAAADQAEQVHE